MTDDVLVLGVPAERIRMLGDSWSDGGLWDDIALLAQRTWGTSDEEERRIRWHHLVMAVGNFKRQGRSGGPHNDRRKRASDAVLTVRTYGTWQLQDRD